MSLEEENEKLKKQLADVMGEGGSYRALQVNLDAALQKHKDDAVAHDSALSAQHQRHESAVASIHQDFAKNMADLKAVYASELETLKKAHAAEIEELKSKTLVPALADLHRRQAADLKAKQEAELKSL